MANEHTDIHAGLGAAARAFAAREGGPGRVRRTRQSPEGFDRAVWSKLGGLGWLGVLLEESRGGAGLGLAEMAVLAREFGRALVPEPLTACGVFAAGLLHYAATPHAEQLLQELIAGDLLPAVAWQERLGDIDVARVDARAIAGSAGAHVAGTKRFVAHGASADGYLVSARADRGAALYWIPRTSAGVCYRTMRCADGTEHGTLTLDRVAVPSEHVIAPPGAADAILARALDEAVVITAAELLGVAERALEITLDYLRTRVQFGKPIGSFQALQHRCVDLFIQKELGISALDAATSAMDSADPAGRAALASRAKSRCADAALDICRKSIQMHGAMGFTDECDIGLYLKRALVLSAWLGNAQAHRRRYASLSFGEPGSARAPQAAAGASP